MRILDLSFLIENNMPTCGTEWHQKIEIVPMGKIDRVGRNTHSILLGSHSGTHIDAPYHFINDGDTIDKLKLETVCGRVSIVDYRGFSQKEIMLEDVINLDVSERMLFVFGWYKKWKSSEYYQKFPFFSQAAIEHLIKSGMHVMAMDTPSPDSGFAIGKKNDSINHKLLLENNVTIIEYLCNTDVIDMSKQYEMYALPLKIANCDGAPGRVILKEI